MENAEVAVFQPTHFTNVGAAPSPGKSAQLPGYMEVVKPYPAAQGSVYNKQRHPPWNVGLWYQHLGYPLHGLPRMQHLYTCYQYPLLLPNFILEGGLLTLHHYQFRQLYFWHACEPAQQGLEVALRSGVTKVRAQ